jgi:hypothetical protein
MQGRGRGNGIRVVLAVLAALGAAWPAQAQLTRGAIVGTVRDSSGAIVSGASVTATNMDTNVARSTVSNAEGFYRISALEAGRYAVRVEQAGFSTVENKDILLRSATDLTLNFDLKVGTMGESLTVLGQAEGVELNKTNPTVGITLDNRQVTQIPLDAARDPLNLIGLAPNVVVARNSSGNQGQGTFAANGNRTRNNNYTIDGSDNNDISVTISTSDVVPEGIAEVQILTNPYNVEFGRNSGAQFNVITKSGTNAFHGEAWEYYRTSGLYSMSNLDKAAGLTEPAKFHRHQAGFDLGGPVRSDKTFFFLLYQYDAQRPEGGPGATTRIPTPEGFAALQTVPLRPGQSAASRQAVLDRMAFLNDIYAQNVQFRSITNTLVNGVSIPIGQTNVNIIDPSTYHTAQARIDHTLGPRDNVFLRYHYNKQVDNNAISNCVFGEKFCGSQDLKDTNIALSETHVFHSALLNEFRFSLVRRNLDFPENDPTSPTATITGVTTIGGDSNYPQSRVTDSYQFSNTLTWTRARHTFKFGVDIRYNKAFNESGFNTKGTFTFDNLEAYMNNNASVYSQTVLAPNWDARQWQNFFFAQDDFRVTPDLTLNLGLRYELSTVPFGMFGATDPESLAVLVPGPSKKDPNNFAPRVGFAWAPRSGGGMLGDGKTVVRGGFGVGYDVVFYNLLTVNGSNYPRSASGTANNVLDVYPNIQTVSGSPVFNALNSYTNSPEDLKNPSARFWSLSVAREVGDFVVELGYSGSKGYNGINQIQVNPGILTADQAALVASTKSSAGIPTLQNRRLHPEFGVRTVIPAYVGPGGNDTEARSSYNAGYLSVQKRLSHGLQLGASVTLSRWMSNNDASLGEGGTTNGSNQRPQDMFNYEAEWSVSQFDRPQRLAFHWVWEIPGPKSGPAKQVLGGWQLSGRSEFQSGRPFTIVTGVDSNGDANTGSDRPNMGSGTLDWKDNKREFTNNGKYVTPLGTNNLPLANAQGNGTAGRNTERGASYKNTNMSLSKRFSLGKPSVTVRFDAFNVFNQDNYGNPTVTMSSTSFGQNTNDWGQRTVTLSGKVSW